jgi:hypothetical protein
MNQSLLEPLGLGVSNLYKDEEAQKRAQFKRSVSDTITGPTGAVLQDLADVLGGAVGIAKGEGPGRAAVKSGFDLVPLKGAPGVRTFLEGKEEEILEGLDN